MITKKNYEIYILDYLENNLSPDKKLEFERFLANNPEIKHEIFGLEQIKIPKHKLNFEEKLSLKKSEIPGLNYFDELCISKIEGNITQKQEKELLSATINLKQKLILKQYQLTKTQAPTLFYPYKNKLKKHKPNYLHTIYKVAAILIIAFSISRISFLHKNTYSTLNIKELTNITNIDIPIYSQTHKITISAKPANIVYTKKQTTNRKKENLKQNNPTEICSPTYIETKAIYIAYKIKPDIKINVPVGQTYPTEIFVPQKTTKLAYNNLKNNLQELLKNKGICIDKNGFKIKLKNKIYGLYVSR